ncbi:MAG: hypothetical protein ACM36C_10530 [Acidobacteriota bacterium]
MSSALRILPGSVALLLATLSAAFAQAPAATPEAAQSAKTWIDHRADIEAYLQSAPVVKMEELKVGVTRPKRAQLAPGGPIEFMAWKFVPPSRATGYQESYKSEIAAYQIDQILGLNMVPPTVEKRVKGDLGAAVMWCSPTKNFKELGGVPTPPPSKATEWTKQIVRAKMFDNLIGNLDPNLGNWLVDPAWNLILIDHTRALTQDKNLVHKTMDHMDAALWEKMKALTVENLTPTLKPWLGKGEIKAIIERRDKMQEQFDKLIAEKGEAAVVLK